MSESDEPKQIETKEEEKDEATIQKTEGSQQGQKEKEEKEEKSEEEKDVEKEVQKMIEEMNINEGGQQEKEKWKNQPKETEEKKENEMNNEENELLDQTKFFVDISRPNIPFGRNILFPGSIEEVDVSIGLKDENMEQEEQNKPLMLRVIAKCNNSEFDALDEYVFSVRSNDRFEYFEEVRFKIRRKERAQVKVAVKIPPVKDNYNLEGVLEIQLESLKPICLPITARCEMPNIICIKDLFKADEGCSMIKVPAKKNQIRMPPIPFKNMSNFSFTLEVEAISNESFSNRPFDIVTQNFVNCQPNMQFFVNIQLKENMAYKGVMPLRDTIRKVLILKIKNSSVYFNYPLEVNVFESTNAGGMS